MKELEIRTPFNSKGLTSQPVHPTLEKRGDIFMPEPGLGEQPPKRPEIKPTLPETESPQTLGGRQITQEMVQKARGAWEELNFGKNVSVDERRVQEMMIAEGHGPVAGGAEAVRLTDYQDPRLQNIVGELNAEINRAGAGNPLDPNYINGIRGIVRDLREGGQVPPDQANRLIGELNTWMVESLGSGGSQERFGFYLQSEDLDLLKENPTLWLDKQFDTLYNLAQEGQELTSPVINNMQTVVSEAIRYVQYNKPDELDQFQRLFTIRFNLIQMRTTIGYKSIQSIQEAAYKLQVHGLLYGLSLEEGRVGAMFNRLNDLLEDGRLKSEERHVKPELINKLQDDLIKEQLELRDKGGIFAGREEADIRRAVRTAFDIFVSSQRMAVIVARGNHLTGLDAYFGDPASGPLNVYNIEDLLTEKFGIFNIHEQELLKEMKLDMADASLEKKWKKVKEVNPKSVSEKDKEDLGRRLFRDIFIVPDFFTSGWRVKGVLDALDERLGSKEEAGNFALFMRLRNTDTKTAEQRKGREDLWGKIATYRPEEIVRLFKERDNDRLEDLYTELKKIDPGLELTPEDIEHNNEIDRKNLDRGLPPTDIGKINTYDKFKEKYGSALSILREEYFRKEMPEQIDMANLNNDQKAILSKALGHSEAGKVVKIFTKMQEYIREKDMIYTLMNDPKFEDIYTRTLVVDDALLSKLELDTWNGKSVTPLSKRYGSDQGGDALVRIWNDTANAIRGAQSLVKFVKTEHGEERAKHALEFADAASLYNGEENRAKIVRFTIGTFLNLSKQDFIWDALGVGKLPFRRAMSKIEKIYGPQAHPMSRDELRVQLDNIHSVLVYHASDKPEEIKQAEELYTQLETLLEVTAKDATKRRAVSVLFFLMLAALLEGYELSGAKEFRGKR